MALLMANIVPSLGPVLGTCLAETVSLDDIVSYALAPLVRADYLGFFLATQTVINAVYQH